MESEAMTKAEALVELAGMAACAVLGTLLVIYVFVIIPERKAEAERVARLRGKK